MVFRFLIKVLTVLFFFFEWTHPGVALPSKQKPNVIIIMVDDQGMGDLSFYGNPYIKTPNVDKLAANSVRFTDYHVSPTCSPTRGSFLTGCYSDRVGSWATFGARELVFADELMMAEVFKYSGYRTAIFGKWHLGDNYPFRPQDRGYDYCLTFRGGAITQSPDFWGNDYFDDTYLLNGIPKKYKGFCTDIWFDEAMKFIRQTKDKPFFVHIPTNIAHVPLNIDERYKEKYIKMGLSDRVAAFYGTLENLDKNVARLLEFLKKEKLADNTLLIYTTDNGSSIFKSVLNGGTLIKDTLEMQKFLNAGLRGHKGDPYEGGHRVPFFIRWPEGKIVGSRNVDALASQMDILPTLIDLCDLKKPGNVVFDGRSLAPILLGKKKTWDDDRILIGDSQHSGLPVKYTRSFVLSRDWRMVFKSRTGTEPELYSSSDRGQRNNVSDQNPKVVKQMVLAYEKWWANIQPYTHKIARIKVGSIHENPVRISAHDLKGTKGAISQSQVNKASVKNIGYYDLEAEEAGNYSIELMRWPPEARGPINGKPSILLKGKPPVIVEVKEAGIKINDTEYLKPVNPDDTSIIFKVALHKGPFRFENMFYDLDKKPVLGAYYILVKKL